MEGQRAAGSVRFEGRLYKASIISVCLLGMILRLACCFWAYPAQFHPDEDAIVANTIDMLQRHSWQAYLYSWPGQLPIKLNALLFSLYRDAGCFANLQFFFCCFPPLIADSRVKLGCISTECASAL